MRVFIVFLVAKNALHLFANGASDNDIFIIYVYHLLTPVACITLPSLSSYPTTVDESGRTVFADAALDSGGTPSTASNAGVLPLVLAFVHASPEQLGSLNYHLRVLKRVMHKKVAQRNIPESICSHRVRA